MVYGVGFKVEELELTVYGIDVQGQGSGQGSGVNGLGIWWYMPRFRVRDLGLKASNL